LNPDARVKHDLGNWQQRAASFPNHTLNLNVGFEVERGPALSRKRVLVSGCYMEGQCVADQAPFV
jgi:hypothetical protein